MAKSPRTPAHADVDVDDSKKDKSFVTYISLHTGTKSYTLGALKTSEQPRRTLGGEAMRWTYILRSRRRWNREISILQDYQEQAKITLMGLGLSEEDLKQIAGAGSVLVRMPFSGSESTGWDGRIFPWEFVLSSATRPYREKNATFCVVRQLEVAKLPSVGPISSKTKGQRILFVQCDPGVLSSYYRFEDEVSLIRRGFGIDESDTNRFRLMRCPTVTDLSEAVALMKPHIIHFAGFDNHEGASLIRENGGDKSPISFCTQDNDGGEFHKEVSIAEFFQSEKNTYDGILLSAQNGVPHLASLTEIAKIVTSGGHVPYLVSLNISNSGARIAPIMLTHGVLAAIGFQDVFDDALAEYFYENLYRNLAQNWHLPVAFDYAWAALRTQQDFSPGSGVIAWARESLIALKVNLPNLRSATLKPMTPGQVVECLVEPKKELNYAELHNNASSLFSKFEIRCYASRAVLDLDIVLQCGMEQAIYARTFPVGEGRHALGDQIRIPLTAALLRTVSEAVQSSLTVTLSHEGKIVERGTHSVRVLPVDQWVDNARSGAYLPSFIMPRDPAVESAITTAQRYVKVIRDDPTAGFEGYQNTNSNDPASLEQVDLQVEAIWSTLLYEWRLGYINPPPTYANTELGTIPLDSQRLRTPSTVRRIGMGTCIDLALLFAACLELVDIYPVIFLLNGHALPGYWRHHEFQARFRRLENVEAVDEIATSDNPKNIMPGVQKTPWKVGKVSYPEIRKEIRNGHLVPLETVRLTEGASFREALSAGMDALSEEVDFDSAIDVNIARYVGNVTPLPILEERK